MTITVEKPSLDADETELPTEATIEAFTDLLKASAPPAPQVAPAASVTYTTGGPTGPAVSVQITFTAPGFYETALGNILMLPLDTPLALDAARCACDTCANAEGPVTSQILAHALQGAALYLERYGWTQGSLYRGARACAVGAIMARAAGTGHRGALTGRAMSVVQLAAQAVTRWLVRTDQAKRGASLESWNDRPEREAHEVVAALRSTANWLLAETAA